VKKVIEEPQVPLERLVFRAMKVSLENLELLVNMGCREKWVLVVLWAPVVSLVFLDLLVYLAVKDHWVIRETVGHRDNQVYQDSLDHQDLLDPLDHKDS